jgi:hypothetical protein
MTPEEYESVLYRIINEFIPGIGDRIEDLTSNYSDRDERPSDYFSDMRSNIKNLLDVIEDEEGISSLEHADRLIARKMFKLKNENEDREEEKKRKAQEEREAKEMENEALAAVVEEHENEQTNRRSHSVKPEMPSQEQMHKPNPARNIFDDVDQ